MTDTPFDGDEEDALLGALTSALERTRDVAAVRRQVDIVVELVRTNLGLDDEDEIADLDEAEWTELFNYLYEDMDGYSIKEMVQERMDAMDAAAKRQELEFYRDHVRETLEDEEDDNR
jgi:hypothetical protein